MSFWLPSASEIARAMACPSSFRAPRVDEVMSVYAARGTTLHEFLRRIIAGATKAEALEEIDQEDAGREACEDVDVDRIPRGGALELALAWNPETNEGRVLGENIGREYEKHGADRSIEFVGSVDFCGKMADGRGLVLDWKSGHRLSAARNSWQLKSLAVYYAAIHGCDGIVAGHLILRDARQVWDLVEWSALDLARFRSELRGLADRLRAAMPLADLQGADVAEGEHCRYCPARQRCPAKIGLVRQLAAYLAPGERDYVVRPEEAARVWMMLDAYDAIAEQLRAEVRKLAAHEGIALGDGRELRFAPGKATDVVIAPARAIEALRAQLDNEAALAALQTTKAAINEASRGFALRNGAKIGRTQEMVLEYMRKNGIVQKLPGEYSVRIVGKRLAP